MKTIKRLLCMAIAIMMLMSCVSITATAEKGAAGVFSDVSNDQVYSNAVSTLNLMGVINGYPDGTFGPDKNVTRAEFTAMLMRTLNLGNVGSSSAAELPFTDVSDTDSDINWAIPNINTAYGMKVINGYEDSTFRPGANVAYEEAVKMIVCTLGYGENVDVSGTPWYANYIAIGNQIGITKTASKIGQVETPATRACIAQLLYDSLEVRLVKNGSKTEETILNSYLGYEKQTGIIASNGVTGIMSPTVSDKDDEVQIYTEDEGLYTYKTSDESLKDYLGHEIEFYYTENDIHARILMLYVLHSSEPVVINAANVEKRSSDAGTLAYYENLDDEDEKELTLESNNVVIYNGKLYGEDAEASRFNKDMVPTLGQIKLTDSNDNGKYDIIEITAYDVYYVSNKDTAKKGIIDNLIAPADKKTVSLDVDADKNLYIVDEDGKEVSYSSISAGNIICIAKSRAENGAAVITTAVVLNDKVTGTITASKNDTVTIAGKEYSYSKAAPWMNGGTLEEPQVQDSGTYFLDLNGDIVAYNKNAVTENVKYGYVLGYYEDPESMEEEVEFRILTTTGATEYLGTYKNTTINGETFPTGVAVANEL
ncbi:MAG: S-layer homology domain-containing protein, partial [Clostridia bacterium]|nr:S-layer homology domain-containing protein [Clostridia bacterium]